MGKLKKILNKNYLLTGLLFGAFNEVSFRMCWDYSPILKWFILGDVPLVAFIGWPILINVCLKVSDRLYGGFSKKLSRKRHRFSRRKLQLLTDLSAFILICAPVELMGAYWFKLFTYNEPLHANFAYMVFGYVCVGLFCSSLGRRFE